MRLRQRPFAAVEQAVEHGGFDEIIISNLPPRTLKRTFGFRTGVL